MLNVGQLSRQQTCDAKKRESPRTILCFVEFYIMNERSFERNISKKQIHSILLLRR